MRQMHECINFAYPIRRVNIIKLIKITSFFLIDDFLLKCKVSACVQILFTLIIDNKLKILNNLPIIQVISK